MGAAAPRLTLASLATSVDARFALVSEAHNALASHVDAEIARVAASADAAQHARTSPTHPGPGTQAATDGQGATAADLAAARAWLADCFGDMPADLTDAEVIAAVERHYVGGWQQFLADGALPTPSRKAARPQQNPRGTRPRTGARASASAARTGAVSARIATGEQVAPDPAATIARTQQALGARIAGAAAGSDDHAKFSRRLARLTHCIATEATPAAALAAYKGTAPMCSPAVPAARVPGRRVGSLLADAASSLPALVPSSSPEAVVTVSRSFIALLASIATAPGFTRRAQRAATTLAGELAVVA